jgi:Raf kinase inhibitor-like YbhB/YbcL family protein
MRGTKAVAVVAVISALLGACGKHEQPAPAAKPVVPPVEAPREPAQPPPPAPEPKAASLTVTSGAFAEGAVIPKKHTADAENVSPPLTWTAGPAGTVAYALIVDDPDAPGGTWVHWVAWNIGSTQLAEQVPSVTPTATGAEQGMNSWQKKGYGGPQPPVGPAHRYYFRVYALDAKLELAPDSDRKALDAAMQGHVLASGELMGTYGRDK